MPTKNEDLHGNAPDKADTALLLIDVINDLDFPEGELLKFATPFSAPKRGTNRMGLKARCSSG